MNQNNQLDKYSKIIIIAFLLIVIVPCMVLNTVDFSEDKHRIKISDEAIEIGTNVFDIDDIQSIELLEEIDIGRRVKGTSTLKYIRGICKVDNDDAVVYVYKGNSNCIKVELDDEIIIYNDKDLEATVDTYSALMSVWDN